MDSFLLSTLSGGIVGFIASFTASRYFLVHNNNKNRPIIDIADKLIACTREDSTPALRIKVINKTDQDLSDIIFVVEGIKNLSPKGSIPLLNLDILAQREVLSIRKFDKNDTNASYAHRINLFTEGNDIIAKAKTYDEIRVSIRATCPYYGTSTVISRNYTVSQDILTSNHSFNTGDSLSVSSHS